MGGSDPPLFSLALCFSLPCTYTHALSPPLPPPLIHVFDEFAAKFAVVSKT